MNIRYMWAYVACGLVPIAGCEKAEQKPLIPTAVESRIEAVHASLMRGATGFCHVREFETTDRLFDGILDGKTRRAAALAFSDMLLSLDLKGQPYQLRETATSIYRKYLYQSLELMNKGGVEPRDALERYFKGLSKYRDSCLNISVEDQMPGESREDYRARRDCACKLRDDFKLTLSIFERFWLPHLSRVLPSELHDEFKQRLKAFSALPSQSEDRSSASNATDGRQIATLLAAQTNSADTVRAIRHCIAEMPKLLNRLPTEEDRAKWIGRWEESLWQLGDDAKSYREKMNVICAVEEAVFAVKAAREKSMPNSGCVWDVVVRWLGWYAVQVAQARTAIGERGFVGTEDEGRARQGIVYAQRHFQRGLLSMFRKKYLYAMRNRWFPELDDTLSPEQAAQVKAKLTAAAERIASRYQD